MVTTPAQTQAAALNRAWALGQLLRTDLTGDRPLPETVEAIILGALRGETDNGGE